MKKTFPLAPDQQVTLSNWRTPPFNRWAFNHVSELVPSATISAHPRADSPPVQLIDLSHFTVRYEQADWTLDQWLQQTYTDSLMVLKNGHIAYEYYAEGQSPSVPHIWMSVSKSVLGLIAGIMVEKYQIDLDSLLVRHIPELQGSAFEGATIRHALDMRVGIQFNEDYHARDGAIIEYRKSHLWDPTPVGEPQTDLRHFFSTLHTRDGEHGGRFHYVSPNTDLLGWLIERTTGERYADLLSDWLWKPIHAERDAYITVDRLGAPRCAGGLCAVPRDMARIGRLLVTGGRVGNVQVVPKQWIDDILSFDGQQAWRSGDFYDLFDQADMHYRSKWYVKRADRPLVSGVGVFGQHVFVDPAADLVIAKCSSQPLPLEKSFISMTMAGVEGLRQMLR
jgi:CubicO group peptidase (beta-lactamase class C family)